MNTFTQTRRLARDIEKAVRLTRYHLRRGQRVEADAALARVDLGLVIPGTLSKELERLARAMEMEG